MTQKNHNLSREGSRDFYAAERLKRDRNRRAASIVLVLVGLLCAVFVGAGIYLTQTAAKPSAPVKENILATYTKGISKKPFYALVIGEDDGEDSATASDANDAMAAATTQEDNPTKTLMLCRVDPKDQKVTLLSIHPEMLVDQDDGTQAKVGDLLAENDPDEMVKLVSNLCGIDIAHYFAVDVTSLMKVVDAVDGITLTLPTDVTDANGTGISLVAGTKTLDSSTALSLYRTLHAYDLYGDAHVYQAANQRTILLSTISQLASADEQTMVDATKQAASSMDSDLKTKQIVGIMALLRGIDATDGLLSGMMPTTSQALYGTYSVSFDEEGWSKMSRRVDAGLSPYGSPTEDPAADVAAAIYVATSEETEDEAEDTADETETGDTEDTETDATSTAKSDDATEDDDEANDKTSNKDDKTDDEDEDTTGTKKGTGSATSLKNVDKSAAVAIVSGPKGGATECAAELKELGFTTTAYEDPAFVFANSSVVYSSDAYKAEAEAIAKYLGSGYEATLNNGAYYLPADITVRMAA